MGVQYILPIYGFIRYWKDYKYAVYCLKLMLEEPELKKLYKMKISPMGVLYFPLYVADDLEEKFVPVNLVSQLSMIDASLVSMNMDGIITMKREKVSQNTYYIKIIPIFLLKFWGILFTQAMWILMIVVAFILTYRLDIFGPVFDLLS